MGEERCSRLGKGQWEREGGSEGRRHEEVKGQVQLF